MSLKYLQQKYKSYDRGNEYLWNDFPDLRWVHNKLELALRCGYNAGPVPVLPNKSGYYCIRPIYNMTGYGIYARKLWIDKDDQASMYEIHPGEFWTEWWTGNHYSIDYVWENNWVPIFATQGKNNDDNLLKFEYWKKIDPPNIQLPKFLDELAPSKVLNIEFKDAKIIEIHLRLGNVLGDWRGVDDDSSLIVVAWRDKYKKDADKMKAQGYKFVENYDHDFSYIEEPRLGFWYK
jgi:hypothetical protein